jgi:hypothetical protein
MSNQPNGKGKATAPAAPVTHQQAHEIQPFGQLVSTPIALSETARRASVGTLIRGNELQVWFLAQHVVDTPLVRAT